MPSPSSEAALEQAKSALNEAQAALDLEAKRISEAEAEVTRLTEEIRSSDPNEPVNFAGLVGRRDSIRGLIEALQTRKSAKQEHLVAAAKLVQQARGAVLHERAVEAQAEAAQAELELIDTLGTAAEKAGALIERIRALNVECRSVRSRWLDCAPSSLEEIARRWAGFRNEANLRADDAALTTNPIILADTGVSPGDRRRGLAAAVRAHPK